MSARSIPNPEQIPSASPSLSEKWELVKRLAASPHLNKAPRLTELLQYITQRALDESASVIHEQEIGANVFGRAADYDTSQDNIVRVQVSQLRKKMERYFETDGAHEPLILEIPRGSYLPVFRRRYSPEAPVLSEPALTPIPTLAPVARKNRWLWRALAVALSLLLALNLWLLAQNRQLRQSASAKPAQPVALNSLWSQLFSSERPTDIVLADSTLSLFQDRLGRQLTLPEYLNRDYETRLLAPLPKKEREDLANVILRRYTSFADVVLLNRMMRLAERSGVQPVVHFARDFPIRNLKNHNVILLGSKRSTLWIELFEPQLNFRFAYQDRRLRVLNTAPQPGELPVYESPGSGGGYAILAFLPNLERVGGVLSLQGDDQVSTEAAGEFVTNEEVFATLQKRLAPGGGRLPWFEALLKTSKVGNAASACEIIALRLPYQPR
jgi:hypothetical protein